MKPVREWFARQKASGGSVTVSLARGVSYLIGPVMEAFGGAWQRHIVAESNESLLRFSPVYACISRISKDISTLRPMLMGPGPGGTKVEITDPGSPYMPLMRRPNAYMTWIQFLDYWMICKLLYGNAYAIKERDARGIVTALYPIDPRRAQVSVSTEDSAIYYSFTGDALARIPSGVALLDASEVVHDRVTCVGDPLIGVPPIYAAAAAGTLGMRIQNNSERFFANMSRPSGHLSFPNSIDPEQAKLLKQEMESGFSGVNVGRVMVTSGGAKFETMSIAAEQAQLAEQLKATVEEVARAFGMPLHKIQAGAIPTYTNIASYNQQYLDDALKPHIEAFEALMTLEVVMKKEYSVELDLSGLFRMDPKTRAERTQILVQSGVLSPNEARLTENLPPVKGGDQPLLQQQMWQIGQLADRKPPDDLPSSTPTEPQEPEEPEDDPGELKEPKDDKGMMIGLVREIRDARNRSEVMPRRIRDAMNEKRAA